MTNWHIGCSGFHYKHWKGSFYPEALPQNKWFGYYCEHFNTLELNVTFYRFPRVEGLKKWYQTSPPHFKFAVKAPKAITHYRKFNNVERFISDFYETTIQGLEDKLGCVLFQLPANFHYSAVHLERILACLDPGIKNVLEFRHSSWWTEDVYQALSNHNISFCGMSHPTLPKDVVANSTLLYYRMHGEGDLYASNYEDAQLSHLAQSIKTKEHLNDIYVFFNNDIHTYAVYNALSLRNYFDSWK